MNLTPKLGILAATVLAFTGASAYGESFAYSYLFPGIDQISATGTFDGTPIGNLITDISNATLTFTVGINNDIYPIGPVYVESWASPNTPSLNGWLDSGATISFDGIQNNFLFVDTDYAKGVPYNYYFDSVSIPNVNYFNSPFNAWGGVRLGNLSGYPPFTTWSVTEAVTQVPEPPAYAAVLGTMALGFAAIRNKKGRPDGVKPPTFAMPLYREKH